MAVSHTTTHVVLLTSPPPLAATLQLVEMSRGVGRHLIPAHRVHHHATHYSTTVNSVTVEWTS